jgi:hypothetical protein
LAFLTPGAYQEPLAQMASVSSLNVLPGRGSEGLPSWYFWPQSAHHCSVRAAPSLLMLTLPSSVKKGPTS